MKPKSSIASALKSGRWRSNRRSRAKSSVIAICGGASTKPFETENGLHMLPQWKHPGLDSEPSWIMTSELNHFEFPGPDIRGSSTEAISFGFLPHKVTTHLREMIRARVREKNISTVDRDFDAQKTLDELQKEPRSTKGRNQKPEKRLALSSSLSPTHAPVA